MSILPTSWRLEIDIRSLQFTVRGNAAWVSTLGPDRGLA
jgi:hypothetical protein